MLKVKNEKGKFDILLNEATFSNAPGSKDIALKRRQNSKGYSSKTPQVWSSDKKEGRKQVRVINQGRKSDKTDESSQMGHHRYISDEDPMGKKSLSAKEGLPTNDASYLTKDQLSRILSSISSHEPLASQKASMKSEGQESVIEGAFTVNSQSNADASLVSDFKMPTGINSSPEQASLSEKNLQWKKELDKQVALKQKLKARKDEESEVNNIEEYNPWGRPGGGAPIRTHSGKKMAQNETDAGPGLKLDSKPTIKTTGQASNVYYTSTDIPAATRQASNVHYTSTDIPAATGQASNVHYTSTDIPAATRQASNVHYTSTDIPAAMRSSFAVGAPGIVKYETKQSKAEEKKKWLQDLEQQIREKKEREAQEKLNQPLKESKYETWHQTPVTVHESSASDSVAASGTLTKQHSPMQPVQTSIPPAKNERTGNVHARGHGLQSLGQVDQEELERKRIKTLEHQLAIKEQVEERRRMKQEEKERRMKEEAEKERMLAQERERLNNQYQEELKMRREKEEEARRRAEALQLNIAQAYQSAQQEKAAKRVKHLEAGGHDVSGLRSGMEAEVYHVTSAGLPSTESSSCLTEYAHFSPRIKQTESELPKEDGRDSSWQTNKSLESKLKEISLSTSLESQWTSSSPVSSRKNDSQSISHLESSRQSKTSTRSQSEKSHRKKQQNNHPIRKRGSLENVAQEDAFMLPYRRTSSATFAVALDTPTLSHRDATATTTTNTSKQRVKKLDQAARQRKTTNIKKRNESTKGSEITRRRGEISSKPYNISVTAEKPKIKQDKANVDAVKVSPEPLPTARQEMILQQLAALRQGLMMKERELNYGAL